MTLIAQLAVGGVAMGFVYALLALGIVLLWNAAKVVNFAHGEFLMLGAYVAAVALGRGWAYPYSLLAVVMVGIILGLGFYWLICRHLRYTEMLAVVVGTVGLSILLRNSAIVIFGPTPRMVPRMFNKLIVDVAGVRLMTHHLGIIGVAAVLITLQYILMYRSPLGAAMRAIADDRDTARMMGVPVETVTSLVYACSAVLAGVAGLLSAPLFFASTELGGLLQLKAFAACVLGGFGSIPGAIVGGLALGLLEVFGVAYISSVYKDVFAFAVLIILLALRPQGFLGERVPIKW